MGDDAIQLIDAGGGRRLDRFGTRLVDRPHPGAVEPRRDPGAWPEADLRFHPATGWVAATAGALDPWAVQVDGLTLELRPTESGQVGLFPEHRITLPWLEAVVRQRAAAHDTPPRVLHLFAHTGLATLAIARSGATVAHVDGSRPAVAWARRNALLSGLADRPVRWLVDDALTFVEREARRGRSYDGIVLDPPSYGHASGKAWRLPEDLPVLLAACARIAVPGAFVLLTAHSEGLGGTRLGEMLTAAFAGRRRPEAIALSVRARSGAELSLGSAARIG
jgi:23S rRNA (cytosine1962-C5)-methyltransferase